MLIHQMNSNYFRLTIFLFVIFITPMAYSQNSNAAIINYNTDNGLPQNSVKDIEFDSEGYCWLTTEMGVVRFDGKSFRTFGILEIPGLTSERMLHLAKDKKGILYAGASSGQVILIRSLVKRASPAPVLINPASIGIGYGRNTGYAIKEKRFLNHFNKVSSGNLQINLTWFCYLGKNGLYSYERGQLFFHSVNSEIKIALNGLRAVGEFDTTPIGKDHLLQISQNNQARVWRNGKLQAVDVTSLLSVLATSQPNTRRLLWCESGTFLYTGSEVYRLNLASNKIRAIRVLNNLKIPAVASIYYLSSQNKYFIGSETTGLYIIKPNQFFYPKSLPEVSDENSYAQVLINDSLLFCRNTLVKTTGQSKHLPLFSEPSVALTALKKRYLYFDNKNVLYSFDLSEKRAKKIGKLDSKLRSIFPVRGDSVLFFSTRNQVGLIKKDAIVVNKKYPPSVKVLSVVHISNDQYLLATEAGLKWYDFGLNKILKSTLDSAQIRTVRYEGRNKFWISTYGKGFYLYQDDILYKMPNGPKKALKTVHAFIEDKKGQFWLPTNNGLYLVNKTDLLNFAKTKQNDIYFYRFDKHDGLRTNEFNGGCDPAYQWLTDSLLSLPSLNGLAWFYPNRTKMKFPDNGIFVDRLVVNNKKINYTGKEIVLPSDYGSFSLTISSPFFGNYENMRLEYMVQEQDSAWLPVHADQEIVPAFSTHGKYHLVIRRRSDKLLAKTAPFIIPVTINPKFYHNWWFILLAFLVATLISYMLNQRRIKSLKLKSQLLEQEVSTRTIELSQAIEELGQSELALLKSNQVKDKIITMVLHDLRSPLRFLSTLCNNLVQTYQTLSDQDLKSKLIDLKLGTKGLESFTEQFFVWALAQQDGFKIHKSSFDLSKLFSELCTLYDEIVKINNNQLVCCETNLSCHTDYHILALIVRNLVDNANKNTRSGLITVKATQDHHSLTLAISDTGPGLTKDQIAAYYDDTRALGSLGTGSILVMGMLQKIDADLHIETVQGSGSTFYVRLENQ